MTDLKEEGKEFKIVFEYHKSFKIGDSSNIGEYKKGEVIYQIKKLINSVKELQLYVMIIIPIIVLMIQKVEDENYFI